MGIVYSSIEERVETQGSVPTNRISSMQETHLEASKVFHHIRFKGVWSRNIIAEH